MTAAHRLSGDQDISPATSPGGTAMLMARFSRRVPVPQEARTAAIASTANIASEIRTAPRQTSELCRALHLFAHAFPGRRPLRSAAATRGSRSLSAELRIPPPKHALEFIIQDLGP